MLLLHRPLSRAELEGEEVEEARRLYALLRQQLHDLRQATRQVGNIVHGLVCCWLWDSKVLALFLCRCLPGACRRQLGGIRPPQLSCLAILLTHSRPVGIILLSACPPASQLRACLGLQPFTTHLAAAPDQGGLAVPALEVTHFLVADSADFVAVQFNTAGGRAAGLGGERRGVYVLGDVQTRHDKVLLYPLLGKEQPQALGA